LTMKRCFPTSRLALLLAVLSVGTLESCQSTSRAQLEPPRPTAALDISCFPADALVYVNDIYAGSAVSLKKHPLILPEGMHRIELRRDGYFSHFEEVRLQRAERKRLGVKLRKEPF
jgi:hypothetical protein